MMKRWVLFLTLALCSATSAWAQATGQISGTVSDASGAAVSGAAVAVGNRGAQTGADGRFTITAVPAGTHQLRVTKVGYGERVQPVTVAAGQTATVNVRLQLEVVQLEQIVAVGYGTARKQDVTGAVASVKAEAVKQTPSPSVGEALKGRVPGVDIVTTGYRPGDNPRIRIRGTRSLVASNDPLIVVDGVAIAGGLGDINPNSIQSIDILKDASATAVYGSRGANGVILITTNKGRAGGTRISYDTRVGVQQIHRLMEVFNGEEFANFRRDAARSNNLYPCPVGQICPDADRLIFTAEELAGIQNGVDENYQELISREGRLQDHQLTITGGSESTRFSIGGNYLDEDGVTLGTGYLRRGATVSVDHTADRFKTGLSLNINNSSQNLGRGNGLWGEALQISPLGAAYNEDGTPNPTPTPDPQRWNPLLDIEHWKRDNLRTRTFGNAFAGYEMLKGVTLQTTFGADLAFRREGEFIGALTQPNRGTSNSAWVERIQVFNYVSTTQLNAERQLGDAHRFNATVLYEIQNQREDRSRADVQNLPYEYQRYHNIGTAGQVTAVSSELEEWALQSFMGRANYTLFDRYYLTFTGRQDCSSRLAPGNKCTFFPSAAAKWRVSDEAFMQNQSLISDLALRASYGRTGNTGIAPYQTQGSLTRTVYSFAGSGAFGFRPNALANPNLEWEKTDQFDLGLEFGILNHRITGSVDAYLANTYDLLMGRQLPATSGFSSVLENVGQTRNRGLELTLSTVNLDGWKGVTWTSDVNFSMNRNEIVSLYGGKDDDVGNRWFIGKPIRVWYDYKFDGIWQTADSAQARAYARRPGDIRVVDRNGDSKITQDADRMIIGNHPDFPDWTGSLSNRFEFGSFDLSALATARWGYTIRTDMWPGQMSSRYNQPKLNYWTPENPSNEFPRPYRNTEGAIDAGAVQFFDGSHWRIRNITLGYDIPAGLTGRLGQGSAMRVYVQAQDPFVFTTYPGFDPEGNSNSNTSATNANFGRQEAGVPSYRTLLIGANVAF